MGVCAHAYTRMKVRGQPWYCSSGAVHLISPFYVCVGGGSSECAHVSLDECVCVGRSSECIHVSLCMCVGEVVSVYT